MYILKFINLYYKIKSLFSYLPKDLQKEVVDDMETISDLCFLAKIQKLKGDNK